MLAYKELRLKALQQSPEGFSSTYAIESKFSDEFWLSRFRNPTRHTFICIASSNGHEESVGHVTFFGPLSAEEYHLPADSGQPPPRLDSVEERWQLLSLYTMPSHRGKKLSKNLCQAGFEYITTRKDGPPNKLVRLMASSDNKPALGLYSALGFVPSGNCSIAQGMRANGDGDLLPRGKLDAKYHEKIGTIMILYLMRGSR